MSIVKVRNLADVYVGDYPLAKNLQDNLLSKLEDYPDQQGRKTNVQATMTEWDFEKDNIHVQNFRKFILNELLTQDHNHDRSYKFVDFWGNVYRKGDYTRRHDHKLTYYSMVYFLKSKWYYSPLLFGHDGTRIRPKPGRYVLFPGYLIHEVPRHRYNSSRITLSGNISAYCPDGSCDSL